MHRRSVQRMRYRGPHLGALIRPHNGGASEMPSDVSAYRRNDTLTEIGVLIIRTSVGDSVADPWAYRD
jgi:hypothetical protein